MKRFFAIVLLSIHLFNIGGYALFFQYYIHKADAQMEKQIFDNKISDAKLIEIKLPVHSPGITDWNDYAVVEGQIQLKDAFYDYVRLKITQDTMYFVCLPNTAKTRLVNANTVTAKEISDVPINKKAHDPLMKKISSFNEYNLQAFKYHYNAIAQIVEPSRNVHAFQLLNPYITSPGKPPNFIG